MGLERRYSLSEAAKIVGVRRHTLKLWLAQCAIVLPRLPRGSKVMLRESQIEMVLRKREAKSDPTLFRRGSAA
jgi:predicted site-specific integrase-resolvase